ncbi:Protein of unknown function [Nitrosospira multiformis]|uniref:Uncharacterized protein n=1 Tax=Nitrosospira multiformis TaxID=1231 RepID=A0A1H8D2L0_9PROT|nr:DUF3024 domain-containing protein [Nitrosospira multiformis]SEN00737.1 Protein of unknown function [Nitrosospira multiformis]
MILNIRRMGGEEEQDCVAKFKKDETKNVWFLYCEDRNSRWHLAKERSHETLSQRAMPLIGMAARSEVLFWGIGWQASPAFQMERGIFTAGQRVAV